MPLCSISAKMTLMLLVCSAFLLGAPQSAFAQCNQTLSVGANVAAAAASAPDGTTICLNTGNYGRVDFANITRTGFVTVRSTTGISAQMSPSVWNGDYVRFSSMTLTSALVQNCSRHVHFIDSTFVAGAPGLLFRNDVACSGDQDLLVDNVSFAGVHMFGAEGRLTTLGDVNHLIVTNSFFGNNGYGDGVQLGGGTNHVIGPGNTFDGVSQAYCSANGGAHCDALQIFGGGVGTIIRGNWFKNSDTHIMAPDSDNKTGLIIENNVFNASNPAGGTYKVQIGTCANCIQRHNTFIGGSPSSINMGFISKVGNPASTNGLVENNIMANGSVDYSYGNGCVGCTARYNLFTSAGQVVGANSVVGNPQWLGGTYPTTPTTWANWQLSTGSPGKNAGNDGTDMGASISSATPPAPPTSLRITP